MLDCPTKKISNSPFSMLNNFHCDGSGCLYALFALHVIQTKSHITPAQDRKLTNEASHEEVGTKESIQLTLLPSEGAPTCREHL